MAQVRVTYRMRCFDSLHVRVRVRVRVVLIRCFDSLHVSFVMFLKCLHTIATQDITQGNLQSGLGVGLGLWLGLELGSNTLLKATSNQG